MYVALSGEMDKTGDVKYYALVVYMPTDVNNDANHNGTDVPSIQLGVNLAATQHEHENDSFGNDYDENSPYPATLGATWIVNGEDISNTIT